jgi:hypothetical protein
MEHHTAKEQLTYLIHHFGSDVTFMVFLSSKVFKAVIMKNAAFQDVTSCGTSKNRCFGGTYRLHHQGENNQGTMKNMR